MTTDLFEYQIDYSNWSFSMLISKILIFILLIPFRMMHYLSIAMCYFENMYDKFILSIINNISFAIRMLLKKVFGHLLKCFRRRRH